MLFIFSMSEKNKVLCIEKFLLFSFEKDCITYILSQSFSILIILMSFTNKLPQIVYMYKSKEIKGLSNLSIYLDILNVLCTALYPFHMGYSFWDYGETVIILIQNIIIFILSWIYNNNKSYNRDNISFSILLFSFLFLCHKEVFSEKSWKIIGSISTLLSMGSKITQIAKSCKEKSTGPLSTITFLMNMVGNLVRIFTNLTSTKDPILIGRFIISFTLNFIIFNQIIYYNRDKNMKNDEKENEKNINEKETNDNNNNKKHIKKD